MFVEWPQSYVGKVLQCFTQSSNTKLVVSAVFEISFKSKTTSKIRIISAEEKSPIAEGGISRHKFRGFLQGFPYFEAQRRFNKCVRLAINYSYHSYHFSNKSDKLPKLECFL